MAGNPDPARITDALWYLWEKLHELEPASKLGGIYAFKPGYHATRKDNAANWPNDYSIEDGEDLGGPSDKAAAIDWTFPDAQAGDYDTIDRYSSRLLASGKDPDDPRLNGWREFYGQADHDTGVEGYDFRYGVPASSDSSHLWHIHLSCDRDQVNSRENMDALLSVLRGEPYMAFSDADLEKLADYLARDKEFLDAIARAVISTDGIIENDYFTTRPDSPGHTPPGTNGFIMLETAITEAYTQGRLAREGVERIEAAIAAGVPVPGLVNLTPEAIGAVAGVTADELADRLSE